MGLNKHITGWILDFLTQRPQFVRIKSDELNLRSHIIVTNTGAPQGAVLSPFLFTIYTNECILRNNNSVNLIKFADDTCLQGLIASSEDESQYRDSVDWFVQWCEDHYLLLNVKKTKEIIIDFRKKKTPLAPLMIKNENVEIVNSYKYLGTLIDDQLDWNANATETLKNVNRRFYFLRKLKTFHVDNTILCLFYKAVVESILTFSITCWGGNIQGNKANKINTVIRKANKLLNCTDSSHPDIGMLYLLNCQRKMMSIASDPSHPLYSQIKYSVRSERPIPLRCNTERYRKSFLPSSVKLL